METLLIAHTFLLALCIVSWCIQHVVIKILNILSITSLSAMAQSKNDSEDEDYLDSDSDFDGGKIYLTTEEVEFDDEYEEIPEGTQRMPPDSLIMDPGTQETYHAIAYRIRQDEEYLYLEFVCPLGHL